MAIDTRAKRQSAAQVGAPLPPSVLPDGSLNAADRSQIGWTYRGIAVTTPPSGSGTAIYLPLLGVG